MMSDVHVLDAPLEPVLGIDAFALDSPSAIASRAAQYLGMSAYAFGGEAIARDLQDDADLLEVPHVRAAGSELNEWLSDSALDQLTSLALEHHTDLPNVSLNTFERDAAAELWRELDRNGLPTTLLALLHYAQRSGNQLEAVAAAGSLAIISSGTLERSNDIVANGLDSDDGLVRALAHAILGRQAEAPPQTGVEGSVPTAEPTSTPVHGTWGLVADDGWHQPGSALHDHLRATATENLYNGPTYFMWSGEYSEAAWAHGATDLQKWRDVVSDLDWLDTVYAHSHGGTVALDALAAGQRIKMLVLMHTPAVHRPASEWATIASNVRGVISMRTRMDLVVLADSLRSGESRFKFNPSLLPHFPVTAHWARKEAWFSHTYFVTVDNWIAKQLSAIVQTRYALIDNQ